MPGDPFLQPDLSPLKKVGGLVWLGGILVLSAEATIMAALMGMAGICALGLIIWRLLEKGWESASNFDPG
jgi:hypothetical protein